MKLAADFRSLAREALKGKWKIAILAGLIAIIIGVTDEGLSPQFTLNFSENNIDASIEIAGQTVYSIIIGLGSNILLGGIMSLGVVSLIVAIILFVIRSIVTIGYAYFNLNLVDNVYASINNLFEYLSDWKRAIVANLLQTIYIFFWTLLFVIPGIIAGFSYSMTKYILAEHPELTANEAITRSKEMMHGNKWRFFCLKLSFIGWDLLAMISFGIVNLWLVPYKEAAYAAFYREVSGTENIACAPILD